MTSSNPPCREGPNQFRPSLTRAPGRRDRRGGEFVGGYVGRLPRHTRSLPNGKPVASSPKSSVSLRIRSSRRQLAFESQLLTIYEEGGCRPSWTWPFVS